MAFIDHDFGNGLTVKNATIFAQYLKFYQNVYPGNGPLSGAVNPTQTSFNRAAYNNTTNRDNIFNQTDFFYKAFTGPVFHSIAFGTEFGQQTGISLRNTGIFPNRHQYDRRQPVCSDLLRSRQFHPSIPGSSVARRNDADANSDYTLYTSRLMPATRSKSRAGCRSSAGLASIALINRRWTRTPIRTAASSTTRYPRKLP